MIDTKTDNIVAGIPIAAQTIDGIVVNNDGSLLMAMNILSQAVDVYDITNDYACCSRAY